MRRLNYFACALILALLPACELKAQALLIIVSSAGNGGGGGGSWGIDHRATSGYVTDPTGDTYSLGGQYPITRGGLTFGYAADATGGARDRNSGLDPRLAGLVQDSPGSASTCSSQGFSVFLWDLPNGAGTYSVDIAAGDANNAQTQNIKICDGSTTKATFTAVATAAGSFMDATGTVYTAANWVTSHTPISVTFAGAQLQILMGFDTTTATLAHVHLSQ